MFRRCSFTAVAAGLWLAVMAAVAPAQAPTDDFLQKTVERYPLDHPDVPTRLHARGPAPMPWAHWERGPVEDLRVYTRTDDGVVWLGGDRGAARFDAAAAHPWDRWQYFAGRRWLSDDDVQAIWVDAEAPHERVWIRTGTGVSRLEWRPMTFEEKAAHFDDMIEARHVRHGFVSGSKLIEAGDLSTSFTTDNDNDGLWTAMYLGAQAYRYAATGSADARAKARRSLDALMRLETITPIEGLYARSYRTTDEPYPHQDNGEWHPVGDGKTEWKGDTSSDESVGHYYGYAKYHDLVATDAEKAEIRTFVRRLTDYLVANDYDLIDVDGEPTRWGQWSDRYYATPEGDYEKALRALELLAFLKTTFHITGDSTYQRLYMDRVRNGQAHWTLDYRRWGSEEWEINYSDDELYYLSIDLLLDYETDPVLREIYLEGLRFTWNEVQPERNALWNYLSAKHGAGPLTEPLRDDARRTLERVPLDMVEWDVQNGHRRDVVFTRNPDRHGRRELNRALPPDERPIHKHNSSPYYADGGRNGLREEAPTFWLLPYWLGRHEGWLP